MENIPHLISTRRYPLEIKIYPYLYDHHLEGNAVLPAVEALILLARAVKVNFPQVDVSNLGEACFPRFLSIPQNVKGLAAAIDVEAGGENGITASLLSSVKSKTGNIRRSVEHARVKFAEIAGNQSTVHPFRELAKLEGECINVPAAAVYRELVPFGKAYQNITGDLSVSRAGAQAFLSGGDAAGPDDDLLGSPFPFDAVLHMACVWTQRFADVVAFPVGFAGRTIYQKTKKRAAYVGRVTPVAVASQPFVFDAWIFDKQGAICEVIAGIKMQDVSGGKMRPPEWIKAT